VLRWSHLGSRPRYCFPAVQCICLGRGLSYSVARLGPDPSRSGSPTSRCGPSPSITFSSSQASPLLCLGHPQSLLTWVQPYRFNYHMTQSGLRSVYKPPHPSPFPFLKFELVEYFATVASHPPLLLLLLLLALLSSTNQIPFESVTIVFADSFGVATTVARQRRTAVAVLSIVKFTGPPPGLRSRPRPRPGQPGTQQARVWVLHGLP